MSARFLSLSLSPPLFSSMRPCFSLHSFVFLFLLLHQTFSAFRNPESGSSTTSHIFSIKNKWPNFNEHVIMMEEEEWDEINIREFTKLVEQHEKTWESAAEELETINVGSDQSKKELKIETLITPKQRAKLTALLHEYADVFAWSYEDMPGLNTNIVVHKIPLEEGCKPVK